MSDDLEVPRDPVRGRIFQDHQENSRAFATGYSMHPAREVSMTGLKPVQPPSNEVSPWPQADRANLTQGELAEDHRWIVTLLSIGPG